MEITPDAGALCKGRIGRTGCNCPVQIQKMTPLKLKLHHDVIYYLYPDVQRLKQCTGNFSHLLQFGVSRGYVTLPIESPL